jgi:hypothetical protein
LPVARLQRRPGPGRVGRQRRIRQRCLAHLLVVEPLDLLGCEF